MTVILGLSGERGKKRDRVTEVGKGWGRRRTDDYGRVPLLRLGVVVGLRRANGALARLGDVSWVQSYDGRDIARRVFIVGYRRKREIRGCHERHWRSA